MYTLVLPIQNSVIVLVTVQTTYIIRIYRTIGITRPHIPSSSPFIRGSRIFICYSNSLCPKL